jgi:hypothetical protein
MLKPHSKQTFLDQLLPSKCGILAKSTTNVSFEIVLPRELAIPFQPLEI